MSAAFKVTCIYFFKNEKRFNGNTSKHYFKGISVLLATIALLFVSGIAYDIQLIHLIETT